MTIIDEAKLALSNPLCHHDTKTLLRIIGGLLVDAERYQWMRTFDGETHPHFNKMFDSNGEMFWGIELDEAIDDARRNKNETV